MIANSNTISALWGVDLRTGQGTLTIGCGNGYTFSHTLSWLHSQVGVHYQVSQVVNRGYGVGNTFAPIMAASTSAAFGNATGAVTAVAAEIGNFAASKIPSATTIGSNGGLDSLRGNPAMQYEWKHIVDDDIAHLGRPLCEDRQINTIPGYIKTANAYISTKATLREKETILAYMNGGFYYE
jgi:hypothetical protein